MESKVDKLIGMRLAQRYMVKSLLGKQKGRRTFLAEDAETQDLVVLKLILFGPDFTWEDLKLFEREAETLKSLEHSAIPQYLDSFEIETALGKGFVLVQTYIAARSLADWVTAGRRFSELELKEIARSTLLILQYLHSQHPAVVHRDLKPSNILLADRTAHSVGTVYLVDFGSVQVAQHGGTMTVVGTYGYMPPEQFGGRSLPASDLYSLGATLVYLASGQHPADFTQPSLEDAIASTPLALSPRFTQWIRQLTKANASQRVPSAAIALRNLSLPAQSPKMIPQSTAYRPKPKGSSFNGPGVTMTMSYDSTQPVASGFLSLSGGSFRIRSTPQNLALRFYQNRIQETLSVLDPDQPVQQPPHSARKAVAILSGLIFAMAISLLFDSIGAFLVLILLSLPLWWFFLSQSSYSEHLGSAELSLAKNADGKPLLTVRVFQVVAEGTWEDRQPVKAYRETQFTGIPVRSLRMMPASFGYCAMFTLEGSEQLQAWDPQIKVAGNRQEITTLLDHVSRWDSDIVEAY